MKLPVIAPVFVSVQPTELTGEPLIEQVGDDGTFPGSVAVTPTVAPTGASPGVITTLVWLTTVRRADAESPEEPLTLIVYVPGEAVDRTAKSVGCMIIPPLR
jgi:hypothetical protein